jgi:hypothetical protein
VLQAAALAKVAVLKKEYADTLGNASPPARSVVARSMLEEALGRPD